MKKIINAKPAAYPQTNIAEYNSIVTFLSIIDNQYIKTDPRIMDKIPNTDGVIELVSSEQIPIGKIEYQIKTLGTKNKDTPKYQCTLEFLAYCENSILPVILIVVDSENEKAYWIHISNEVLFKLSTLIKGDSVNVDIPIGNIISKSETQYVKEWENIVLKQINRLIDYDSLTSELELAKRQYLKLRDLINPAYGIENSIFKEIHKFLDYYNYLLENDFIVIKEVFYSEYWKIGLAYSEYNEKVLSYSLFPIKYIHNDVQIKELDRNRALKEISFISYVRHFSENPIKRRPLEYAYEYIIKDLVKLIDKNVLLPINEYIAKEYIFAIIDSYHDLIGLNSEVETFTTEYINQIFPNFLLLFCEEYYKQIKNFDFLTEFQVDLDYFNYRFPKHNRDALLRKARERWMKSESCKMKFTFVSKDFNVKYFSKLISYLQEHNIQAVKRIYPRKSKPEKRVYLNWDVYTPEQIKNIVNNIYSVLPTIYDRFIDEYFPKIKDNLKFYTFFNRMIINIRYEKPSENFMGSLMEERIFLKNIDNPNENRIDVYLLDSDDSPITWQNILSLSRDEITIDNENYNLIQAYSGQLKNVFTSTPMQLYIIEILKNRFENYFKLYRKGSSKIFKDTSTI
jgi:hypothetical protein